jgi:hypothetical protein
MFVNRKFHPSNINHVDGWDVLFTNINHVDGWDVLYTNINHVDGWDVLYLIYVCKQEIPSIYMIMFVNRSSHSST